MQEKSISSQKIPIHLYQSGDWRREKHVPIIEVPIEVKKSDIIKATVTVGRVVSHPNNIDHHIKWVSLMFLPQEKGEIREIATACFSAHGEGKKDQDGSGLFTEHEAVFNFSIGIPGRLYATACCNVHGIWQSFVNIKLLE